LATAIAAVVVVLAGSAAVPASGLRVPSRLLDAVPADNGTPGPTSLHVVVGSATDPATGGYWLVASDGGVFAFNAPFYGSAGGLTLNAPIVGMAATPDGGGYWLVASDGGIFAYGDARFFGSMGGHPLNAPIVGMSATPDGGGYWFTAADGGVFAFGNAGFFGSMGGKPLNAPVVAMAATPGGGGYWFTAADGGVFAFGSAPFFGSMGGHPLNRPIVSMAATPDGAGYWFTAADGGLFAYGDAPFYGSAVGSLQRAAVSIDPTGSGAGTGYRVVSADGNVYSFGSALYFGGVVVPPLAGQAIVLDPGHDGGNALDPGFINQPIDGGGFTESCDTVGTETAAGYPEHAFNFDVATRLSALLEAGGAKVVMTRYTDTGVGPCVNVRAAIGNDAGAALAVSIHADGGPVTGQGFSVDVPQPVVSSISNNTAIVGPSLQLGMAIRNAFAADTGEPVANYTGTDGIVPRDDLGGLDLSTIPKVLIECANMQNPADAALTESPSWRQLAAQGIADGITADIVSIEVP
jgi:N-acetylmuramoyl-L-alanine amidase